MLGFYETARNPQDVCLKKQLEIFMHNIAYITIIILGGFVISEYLLDFSITIGTLLYPLIGYLF